MRFIIRGREKRKKIREKRERKERKSIKREQKQKCIERTRMRSRERVREKK